MSLLATAGLLFPLSLTLVALSAGSPEETEGLSVFVQGFGYATAAAFTFAFGVLHDLPAGC